MNCLNNKGCWYGVFGMTAQKKFLSSKTNFAPQEICELALLHNTSSGGSSNVIGYKNTISGGSSIM